jgi:hypothetical protein
MHICTLKSKNPTRKQSRMEPTSERFSITLERLPHGFLPVSLIDLQWFEQTINSDIRYYYRMIRSGKHIVDYNPIGRSGITGGELALYIIRENHSKRQRRY